MKLSAKGKRPVSKKTLKAVSGTNSAKLKVVLSKTAYSPLITTAVLKAVSKTVSAIDRAFLNERRIAVNLGGLLAKLQGEIISHLTVSGQASSYQAKTAFRQFVQVRFKCGETYTNELIRLAERQDLHRLGLPTTVLIELSRLDAVSLKKFMTKHPTAALKKLPFKEIKKLVRADNPNKRVKISKSDSSDSTVNVKVIAEKIKSNFDKVRVEFDGDSSLDKSLDSVLGEISKWYLDKKVA
ncbi:hypothetical protein [Pseudobdellovibrio exovorus]|uniref:Uncharacterized protein n=1 Tax=Pseudobdellovibrio exovorus JSS TaxID=1184267 RepID=M4VDH2_9BACT|nr:hypothetical protein [Pseudobdellovibrio exovorus]AGH96076.1 hypothetical protein A11Q_1860 [Pseudobdellovibrio exovorus JSS]